MSEIRDYLAQLDRIGWGTIERFVYRHGREFEATPKPKHLKWGKPGQCFCNATQAAFDGRGRYVEGFGLRPGLVPLQHAWLEVDGKAVDLTWRPKGDEPPMQYFGILFETDVLRKETIKNGFYGLLDTGSRGINLELMERMDPDFVTELKAEANKRRLANVKA